MSGRIPQPRVPIVDAEGMINPDWYRYFVSLAKDAGDAAAGEVAGTDGLTGSGAVADGVELSIADGGVTDVKLREGLGTSVVGRFINSTGQVADIQAVSDNSVLARQGGMLVFTPGPIIDALTISSRAVTASTAATSADYFIVGDATAGVVTVTLPSLTEGRLFVVKKIDASANAVTLSGGANIDGAASASLTVQYSSISLIGGATEWHIL